MRSVDKEIPYRLDMYWGCRYVAHTEFSHFTMAEMDKFFGEGKKVLLDLKGLLNRKEYEAAGYSYWRL